MEAQKPTVAKQAAKKEGSNVAGIKNAFLVILACFVVAVLLFMFWFGHAQFLWASFDKEA